MTTNELMARVAKAVFPCGAVMSCKRCKRQDEATMGDCAAFLRLGWPRCCGRTVQVVAKEEWA